MRFLYLFLILFAINNVRVNSVAANNEDPLAEDNNGILWHKLQPKLKTVLNEKQMPGQSIAGLKRSLDDQGNKWITILRRHDGSVNFYRGWSEYQTGFGNLDGEFFIGLDNLHAMTSNGAPQELLIVLEDWKNQTVFARYDLFQIDSEAEKYALRELGEYSGTAGDSLSYHKGMKFTTKDQDNDLAKHNCAITYLGAWWFNSCRQSNLNGIYRPEGAATLHGIAWYHWKGNRYDIKYAEMLIRNKI